MRERDSANPGVRPGTGDQTSHAGSGMSLSMHDGVEVWCDCCSCEAEPYWVERFEAMTAARQRDDSGTDGTGTDD